MSCYRFLHFVDMAHSWYAAILPKYSYLSREICVVWCLWIFHMAFASESGELSCFFSLLIPSTRSPPSSKQQIYQTHHTNTHTTAEWIALNDFWILFNAGNPANANPITEAINFGIVFGRIKAIFTNKIEAKLCCPANESQCISYVCILIDLSPAFLYFFLKTPNMATK